MAGPARSGCSLWRGVHPKYRGYPLRTLTGRPARPAGLRPGLRYDHDAVVNGLTPPWNSGMVEGNVNRIILWNQNCQIGLAWAWRTSTIGRMVALAGRSSCR